jgi:hypothetical protein
MRPVERKTSLVRGGVLLRQQPPIRVWYCTPRPNGDACADGSSCAPVVASCLQCRFPYCAQHVEVHQRRLTVPPDAWKTVAKTLRKRLLDAAGLPVRYRLRLNYAAALMNIAIEGRIIHPGAPARIAFCRVPHAKNVDLACAHAATTCTAGSWECPRCRFSYCNRHFPTHVYQAVATRGVWLTVAERFEAQLELCVKAEGRRLIRVRVPKMK